jgi:hypothetical protein
MDWRIIYELQYPHWLMVAGGALVVVGFIGFAFQKNKEPANEPRLTSTEKRNSQGPPSSTQLLPPSPFESESRD